MGGFGWFWLVFDVFWWFWMVLMVFDGCRWFLGGFQWFLMVFGWFWLVFDVFWWLLMVFGWFLVVFGWFLMFVGVFWWFLVFLVVFYLCLRPFVLGRNVSGQNVWFSSMTCTSFNLTNILAFVEQKTIVIRCFFCEIGYISFLRFLSWNWVCLNHTFFGLGLFYSDIEDFTQILCTYLQKKLAAKAKDDLSQDEMSSGRNVHQDKTSASPPPPLAVENVC